MSSQQSDSANVRPQARCPALQPPQSTTLDSSSSSNFDPNCTESELYSPAEVRAIEPVGFDEAARRTRVPAMVTRASSAISAAAAAAVAPVRGGGGGGGSRRERRTEVNIEADVPSVPASPLSHAQESVRQFSDYAALPEGAAPPGSPSNSVAELISRYTRSYHSGVEASLHYVVAVLNPSSGETTVSQLVLAGLRDELGTKRVLALRGELFVNPAPLRRLIKEQAVVFHPPGEPVRQQRGTVVVCGGDGTISFLMTQVDLVRRELEMEFMLFLSADEREQLQRCREGSITRHNLPDPCDESAHPFFTLPAIAPLPLGTGNDYSNCLGFGKGFSPTGSGWCGLCALCGCGDDGESQVAAALMEAVNATCVPFDRWEVSLVPLRVAQAAVRPESASRAATREGSFPTILPSSDATFAASASATAEAPATAVATTAAAAAAGPSTPSSAIPGVNDKRSPLWNRAARPSNVANAVNLVDWERLYATGQASTHGLINYLGLGYDAYVTGQFDATRRAHPALCSTRTQNKAMYVSLGIQGALTCKKLRKIVPMICVPRPFASAAAPGDRRGGGDATTTESSFAGTASMAGAGSFSTVENNSLYGTGRRARRDLVALQLPSMTKALVVSNVNCYSAGTHPWNPASGEMYYRPVTLRNGEIEPSAGVVASNGSGLLPPPSPVARPVAINDRAFELQTMGGILHYSSLGFGLSSSTKLTQTDELFAFVLCTPEDLCFPSGQCSTFTQLHLRDKYESRIETDAGVRASLSVQIDGEAMPCITEATIVHVRRQVGTRILVRCRNAEVVQ